MADERAKWDGTRTCYKVDGAPKAAFATRRAAERAIPKTSRGLHAYRCDRHGWHLGHG